MRNRAFLPLIEQILMIAVFAIAAAICIGCFASARKISLETEMTDRAVILAQNTAENIKLEGLYEAKSTTYDDELRPSEDNIKYTVICEPIEDEDEFLGSARIYVVSDEKTLFELTVCWQEELK